ncbi:MAG: hypothetical protein AAGI50_00205 [Pseudomonadota bacterium]
MTARALAAGPDILLCDEIPSALDVTIQAHVLDLLRRLQAQWGIACVFITHLVSDLAHGLMVLDAGEIRDIGMTRAVTETPRSLYKKRLISAFRANERTA